MGQGEGVLPRYRHQHLAAFGAAVLRAAGARAADAAVSASFLVEANLQGVDSHGVARLPFYTRRMVKGLINPRPRPRVVRRRAGCALLDGDNGLGVLVGRGAMLRAVALARCFGVGAVVVRNSNHYGAAGLHCALAAERGMIGLSTSNGEACLPPWGGRRPFFSNNPFALAAPARRFPVVVDFATSVATRGHLMLARQTGTPIPEGWALDAEGRPTTDPAAAGAGSLLPIAGAKGYALAAGLEILCGVLGGGAYGPGVKSLFANWTDPTGTSHFFQAIDPGAFMPRRTFLDRMDEMVTQIADAPQAVGSRPSACLGSAVTACAWSADVWVSPCIRASRRNWKPWPARWAPAAGSTRSPRVKVRRPPGRGRQAARLRLTGGKPPRYSCKNRRTGTATGAWSGQAERVARKGHRPSEPDLGNASAGRCEHRIGTAVSRWLGGVRIFRRRRATGRGPAGEAGGGQDRSPGD